MVKKKNKYKNKFEAKLGTQLSRAKQNFDYEKDKLPYYFTGHYIPDFVLHLPGGKRYIEAKGYLRPEHKRKMVAVKKLHPTLDIRIVFYARRPKDIKWAEKHGFAWAVGTIPKEWLDA